MLKKSVVLSLSLTALLAGCASPRPPTINNSMGDANTPEQIASKNQDDKIDLLQHYVGSHQKLPPEAMKMAMSSKRYVVHYGYEDVDFKISTTLRENLLKSAKNAKRIMIAARTDGYRPSRGDLEVARKRAEGARNFLVRSGIDPTLININYVSATDYTTENVTPTGRAQNRRVEIAVILKEPQDARGSSAPKDDPGIAPSSN